MAPHERNNSNNKMAKFSWICKTMQNQSIEMVLQYHQTPTNRSTYWLSDGSPISVVLEATNHYDSINAHLN